MPPAAGGVSAAVMQSTERVTTVRMDGLALMKIVKHCHESLPQMVTGSLLGLNVGNGILEITHAFPFPTEKSSSSNNNATGTGKDAKGKDGGDAISGGDEANAGGAQGNNNNDADQLEGHEFQLEMMRLLRDVNVDNNCVGWYQSMYLGIYSTLSLLENQYSYQTDLNANAVVLLYDPLQTTQGQLRLQCYRLSDSCLNARKLEKNTYMPTSKMFEQVPIQFNNPGFVRILLSDISVGVYGPPPNNHQYLDEIADVLHNNNTPPSAEQQNGGEEKNTTTTSTTATSLWTMPTTSTATRWSQPNALASDLLDLSTNPYLEKHLEFMSSWVDDLASEQHKFQVYQRQVARTIHGKDKKTDKSKTDSTTSSTSTSKDSKDKEAAMKAAWLSSDAPKRLESLLLNNQIRMYCDQMDACTGGGLGKLFVAQGLHRTDNTTTTPTNETTTTSSAP